MDMQMAVKILEERFVPTSEHLKQAIHCGIACIKEKMQQENAEKCREKLFQAMHKMLEAHLIMTDVARNAPEVFRDFQTNVIGMMDEHISLIDEEDQVLQSYQELGTAEEIRHELECLATYRKIYGTTIEKRS